ncbi:MAG: hypothetical protein M1497_03315 [Nitrospirae bacterium]|nr:hypothetical protein [Nitrospirota bacterium]
MKGVTLWLLHRITGLLLIAGLAVHFAVMHFSGPEGITHEVVLRRLSNPWWIAFNLAFLAAAIYHGFYGLRGLAVEYVGSLRLQRVCLWLIVVTASLLMGTGIYILTLG